jgi:hypothetical protein
LQILGKPFSDFSAFISDSFLLSRRRRRRRPLFFPPMFELFDLSFTTPTFSVCCGSVRASLGNAHGSKNNNTNVSLRLKVAFILQIFTPTPSGPAAASCKRKEKTHRDRFLW